MGSSGTGNFSDYSKHKSTDGKSGGSSGTDKCAKAFKSALEDISRCDYFINNTDVPPIGEEIIISFNSRLVAVNLKGEEIGYLPTKYNYLKVCMDNGFRYIGHISMSDNRIIPIIDIDVVPE